MASRANDHCKALREPGATAYKNWNRSRTYESRRLRVAMEPLRDVGTRLVDYHCKVVSLRDQLPVAALYNLAVVLFRLDHEQKLVHESGHAPRGTCLA